MTSSALADQGSPRSFTQFLSLPRTTTSSLYMPLPTTFSPRRSMKWCCCATEPERERTWEHNTNCDSLLASRESLSYWEQRAMLLQLQIWMACHRYYIELSTHAHAGELKLLLARACISPTRPSRRRIFRGLSGPRDYTSVRPEKKQLGRHTTRVLPIFMLASFALEANE